MATESLTLSFNTADNLFLFDPNRTAPSTSFTSGDTLVVRPGPQQFTLIDADFGPLGAASVDLFFDLAFGLVFEGSLGTLPSFSHSFDVGVDVAYPDFVFAQEASEITFDFSRPVVRDNVSSSTGIGAEEVINEDGDTIARGLELKAIAELELGFRDIYLREPFALTGTSDPEGFDFFEPLEEEFTLFRIDANSNRLTFDLGDFFDLELRLPEGAATSGRSQSTVVSDAGFSNTRFLELIGDLDLLLTTAIKSIPGIGAIGGILENTLFFNESFDLSNSLDFLPEDLFTIDLTVADVSGKAGLNIREEVTVDVGFTGDEPAGIRFGGDTNPLDELGALFGLVDQESDPGAGQTPQVRVTLVSDNGTPDDTTDDRIATGQLGEDITLATPTIGSAREVSVTPFFDVDNARVTHSAGVGGNFQVDITVLKLALGGDIGQLLGIDVGPLFSATIPEGGVQFGLFDIFTNRFDIQGGRFEGLPGGLDQGDAGLDSAGLSYDPGFYNQVITEPFTYVWSQDRPGNFDPDDPDALERLLAFSEAVDERIAQANDVFQPFFDDLGITRVVELRGRLLQEQFGNFGPNTDTVVIDTPSGRQTITDLEVGTTEGTIVSVTQSSNPANTASRIENTAAIWPAANAGGFVETVLDAKFNNLLIAAPTEGQGETEGLVMQYAGPTVVEGNTSRAGIVDLTATSPDSAVEFFFTVSDLNSGFTVFENYSYDFAGSGLGSNNFAFDGVDTALPINVLGTGLDDAIVYTGSEETQAQAGQPGPGNSGIPDLVFPLYLDGGSPEQGTDNDVFYANFEGAHFDARVSWDIRAQQLEEQGKGTVVVTNTIGGVERDFRVGDFTGTKLQFFNPDGSLSHETVVRDIERHFVRFGGGQDFVRTGTEGQDYLELSGGDDILAISSDRPNGGASDGRDRFSLGDGDDLVNVERVEAQSATFSLGDLDLISGGRGFDEVVITLDSDDPARLISAADEAKGLHWSLQRESDNPLAAVPVFGAGLRASDAFILVGDLARAMNVGEASRTDRDGWSGVLQTDFEGQDNIRLNLAGSGGTRVDLGDDIEAISVEGAAKAADLVFYTGGTLHTGGTLGSGPEPVDVFVADFELFEGEKARTVPDPAGGTRTIVDTVSLIGDPSLQENPGELQRVFADALLGGFEKFFVKATSGNDLLIGGALDDELLGRDGNDQLSGRGGSDFLAGGRGSDVFVYEASLNIGAADRIIGDRVIDDRLTRLDDDLLIVRAGAAIEAATEGGLSYEFVDLLNGTRIQRLDANSSVNLLNAVVTNLRGPNASTLEAFELGFGDLASQQLLQLITVSGIERTNIETTDAHDDVLIYDGGVSYIAGERAGDKDLLFADFSDQSIGLTFIIEDDPALGREGARLENGVFFSGIDRLAARFGAGDDTVRGGRLDDRIEAGAGDDALAGKGGNDRIEAGAGDDLVYFDGDDGFDTVLGQADEDRLVISNTRADGSAFGEGGIVQRFTDQDTFAPTDITARSSTSRILKAREDLPESLFNAVFIGRANEAEAAVTYSGFEAIDIVGSDDFDDAIFFQGGLIYAGGEGVGDRDLFVADFTSETADLTLTTDDAGVGRARTTAFTDIGNGVQVGEFERLFVASGSGNDQLRGGRFNDRLETGPGNDTVEGSLGSDDVFLGRGNDRATFIGGSLEIDGGDGIDRFEIGAQQGGYFLFGFFDEDAPEDNFTLDARLETPLAGKRTELGRLVNTDTSGKSFAFEIEDEALFHKNFEFIDASGAGFSDILISGTLGGTLSGDGGDDILISLGGDDFLIGGTGRDAYVFGESFGNDLIANESEGVTELYFIGLDFADLAFSVSLDPNRADLFISTTDSSLVIRDYFKASTNPQNFLFFTDDAPQGRTADTSSLAKPTPNPGPRGVEQLGTDGPDVFDRVTDGDDSLFGFGGNDVFFGSLGADIIDGSLGEDLVTFQNSTSGVVVDLTNRGGRQSPVPGAQDTGDFYISIEDLTGSQQSDFLFGSADDNRLSGLGGNDFIEGFAGNDLIVAGPGRDVLAGGTGDDRIFGGEGDDTFLNDALNNGAAPEARAGGNDTLIGQGGDDRMEDRFGDNVFEGGAGNDTAEGGTGADLYIYTDEEDASGAPIVGSGGLDRFEAFEIGVTKPSLGDGIDFSEFGAAVVIDLDDPASAFAGSGARAGTVERAAGAAYSASVDPAAANVRLLDMAGVDNALATEFADVLIGSATANRLDGGAGDDTLIGAAGNDTLVGGIGFDTADYSAGANGIVVDLTPSVADPVTGDLFGTAQDGQLFTDLLGFIDAVVGTVEADRFQGSDADETFTGLAAGQAPRGTNIQGDTVIGGGGIDTLDYSRTIAPAGLALDTLIVRLGFADPNDSAQFDPITRFYTDGSSTTDQVQGFERFLLSERPDDVANLGSFSFDLEIDLAGGDDTLLGGFADETVIGGTGNDDADLGRGDDRYIYESGRDTVDGGDDFDVLDLSRATQRLGVDLASGQAVVRGTTERLVEFSGIERIVGSTLDDALSGAATDDDLLGNTGDDLVRGNAGDDRLQGNAGDDTLEGGAGDDTLEGGTGSDTAEGGADDDLYLYTAGQDSFDGGTGFDTLAFAANTQAIVIDGETVRSVDANAAVPVTVSFDAVEAVTGTNRDDILEKPSAKGTDGRFVFDGAGGDDTAFTVLREGSTAFDFTFRGGAGFDVIDYSRQPSLVVFSAQFSRIDQGIDADLELGEIVSRDDRTFANAFLKQFVEEVEGIVGTRQNDILRGSTADNLLVGGAGQDTIDGREGDDTLDFGAEGGTGGAVADLAGDGTVTDSFGRTDQVANIENLIGTAQGDTLKGDGGANRLDGAEGDDLLEGGAGDDTLIDGPGVDTLRGGADDDLLIHAGAPIPAGGGPVSDLDGGFDEFFGGAGFDIVDFSAATGSVLAGINSDPNDTNFALTSDTEGPVDPDVFRILATYTQVEGLVGSAFDDVLNGDGGANRILAGAGDDTVTSSGGADTLDGGAGFDVLRADANVNLVTQRAVGTDGTNLRIAGFEGVVGGDGDNFLLGDARANVFEGGDGIDTIQGGDGRDTLDYRFTDAAADGTIGTPAQPGVVVLLDATVSNPFFATASSGGRALDVFGQVDVLSGIEDVIGSFQDDFLSGDASNNRLTGRQGDDTLSGGDGVDTLEGGAGADVFVITEGSGTTIVADFDLSTDTLDLRAFERTEAERALAQRPTDENLLAEGALLRFVDGSQLRLTGLTSAEVNQLQILFADPLPPLITTPAGGGEVEGTGRAERFQGQAANDTIVAGGGDDSVDGGAGNDFLDGGQGRDIVSYKSATVGGVFVDLEMGRATGAAGNDFLRSIEGVEGSEQADEVQGAKAPETFDLGGGDDSLRPGAGADEIMTGAGEDTVSGTRAELDGDRIGDFEPGDMVEVENTGLTTSNVKLTQGSAIFEIDADGDGAFESRFVLEETGPGAFANGFSLSPNADGSATEIALLDAPILSLTDAADALNLGASAAPQVVLANAGDDTVTGGAGDDVLDGGEGGDRLLGGDGADTLIGAAGPDTLTGGPGADTFGFDASSFAPGLRDSVTDFTPGLDTLVFTGFGQVDLATLSPTAEAGGTRLDLGQGRSLLLEGVAPGSLQPADIQTALSLPGFAVFDQGGRVRLTREADAFATSLATGADVVGDAGDDTLSGGPGNDTLNGGVNSDVLIGGGGNDSLLGGAQPDTVNAGAGEDTVVGGPGADRVNLGTGDDLFEDDVQEGPNGADTVLGGDGDDTLIGRGGDDVFDGGFNEDSLLGGTGNDLLRGGAQADTIRGGEGNDTVFGDAGPDTATLGTGDDLFEDDVQEGPNGADTVLGGDGDDTLIGRGGDDVLDGGFNEDSLLGGTGNDLLRGGAQADTIRGGEGDDTVFGDAGADTATLGMGDDLFEDDVQEGPNGADTVLGGDGDDTLIGRGGDDVFDGGFNEDSLLGGTGNDLLRGGAQADTIRGGEGDDTVFGDAGPDTVSLGTGDDLFQDDGQTGPNGGDTVTGGDGDDTLIGRGGDDVLDGGFNEDSIEGGDGDDLLLGGAQADTILGGTGNDTVFGDAGPDSVDLGSGNDVFADDAQTGVNGADTVVGGAGNDTLAGRGGADDLQGGDGRDLIEGGAENDRLDGGAQADTLDGGTGSDTLLGGGGDDSLDGGAQPDTIDAGAGNDTVLGGAGADTIDLGAGNDRFEDDAQTGANGADTVFGGAGNDTLIGGGGADRLSGGEINDTLVGGGGADTFVFEDPGTGGIDRVADFRPGIDTIALDGAGFMALPAAFGPGNLRLGAAAADGDDFIVYTAGSLFYDADADGPEAAVRFAILSGAPMLNAEDLEVF